MFELTTVFRWGASLCWALAAGRLLLDVLDRESRSAATRFVAGLALAGAVLTALAIAASAMALDPDAASGQWNTIAVLAAETWGGRMATLRLGLGAAAALVLWLRVPWGRGAAFLLLCSALFLIPFSGHAVTAEPVRLSLVLHGIHVCSVLLWAGGVMSLAGLMLWSRGTWTGSASPLQSFSPIALGLVLTGIASGFAAGYLQAGAGAALFGTFYGQLLLLKCLLLFGLALPCAAWLRWRFLPGSNGLSPRVTLLVEAAACLCLIGVATLMSQSVPARHDDVVWPLPFRLDFSVLDPERDGAYVLQGHLIFAAVMLVIVAAGAFFRKWTLVLVTGGMGLLIGGLGVMNLAIPAYPTTFATSQSSFSMEALARAEPVFMEKCARCHGPEGYGDGPDMLWGGIRAADLTVHATQHTPGDIYWWITHGIPDTAMPGAWDETTDQQRWDLVNYLRFISFGARSSAVTGDVTVGKALLPSVDFGFVRADGSEIRLRDLEGSRPVLLVIGRSRKSIARLQQLQEASAALSKAGLTVVAASPAQIRQQLTSEGADGLSWVPEERDVLSLAAIWKRYFGIFPNQADPSHLEFLVDRFGYVRAKWRGGADPLPDPSQLIGLIAELDRERRLLPSPEEHVH